MGQDCSGDEQGLKLEIKRRIDRDGVGVTSKMDNGNRGEIGSEGGSGDEDRGE